ncbi:MAG: RNA polymerase sigma factor [Fimbriimonadales bacterium]
MDFEGLIDEHRDAVYRQMVRVCGNYDDADDVLVQALEKAFQFSHQLRDPRSFRAWLSQIGKRICIRMRHKQAFQNFLSLAEINLEQAASGEPSPQEIAEAEELKRCVLRAIDEMPQPYKEVYRLRDMEGLTGEEAAKQIGIPVETMKTRLHRARGWLRDRIEGDLSCTPQ